MEWKNTTRNGSITCSETMAGRLAIAVHRHIHNDPDDWLVTCPPFFDRKLLNSKELEDAKRESLAMVREVLSNALNELTA